MIIFWKQICINVLIWGNEHDVEFHEIEIRLFHEIKITIMRSNLYLVMRSKLGLNICQIWSWGRQFDHEIEIQNKALLGNFDLMNDLLVTSMIMRLNVFMHRWLIIRARISHKCNLLNLYSLFWISISWSYLELANRSWDQN